VDYADNKQFDLHWGWYLGAGLLGALIGAGLGAITSALLTGSFGSNISSVFAGAKLLGNMVKAGGVHASAIMVSDNFRNALHQPTHVFWSGGDIAMNGGKSLAQNINGTTLEMTKLGQYLTNNSASIDVWKIASANFAQQVSPGSVVFSVQNIAGLSINGIWATIEFPILAKRGIDILYLMLGEL
jgi:hypothetical protein